MLTRPSKSAASGQECDWRYGDCSAAGPSEGAGTIQSLKTGFRFQVSGLASVARMNKVGYDIKPGTWNLEPET